jgi:hypothetical protein
MSSYGFAKDVANAAACILLIAGGLLTICLTLVLPRKAPEPLIIHFYNYEIIIAGAILIILAITPIVTVFNKGNLKWKVVKFWRNQTIRELNDLLGHSLPFSAERESPDEKPSPTSKSEVVNVEEVKYTKAETMITCIDEPSILEDDPNLSAVVEALELSRFGELSFPRVNSSAVTTQRLELKPDDD